MMKKQNLKKKQSLINKERGILWGIVCILLVAQGISAWYLIKMWSYGSESSQRELYTFINKSEEERYQYPVIDITENRVYIPEARIYLPLNDTTRNLRYDYFKTPDITSLSLSTSSIVGAQNKEDDHACDKVVMFSLSKDPAMTTYTSVGEVQPTKDGLRYISVHSKDTCRTYDGTVREGLVEAARATAQY